MLTISQCLLKFETELAHLYGNNECRSIGRIVLAHIRKIKYSEIPLHYSANLNDLQEKAVVDYLNKLKKGMPVQYLLEETEFYGLLFFVKPGVLIPRQETEELVDWIIKENPPGISILDIGTGSGCIAVSLAKNINNSRVDALDISDEALSIARENANRNKVHINFIQDNILDPLCSLTDKYDIIVSNPPYIRQSERNRMLSNVIDYEPHMALFVEDVDPLAFYKAIIQFAKKHLKPNGKIYFEINEAFGEEMKKLLNQQNFTNIVLRNDLNGKARMISGVVDVIN